MRDCIHINVEDIDAIHRCVHPSYAFSRRDLIPAGVADRLVAALYEIPPGKANIPYHYHALGEECFFILRGEGLVKTPDGERPVRPGDFLFFPANERGAHKLTNTSETEPLVYLDVDSETPVDVALYPDSGKVGVFGGGLRQLYRTEDQVDYYDGE